MLRVLPGRQPIGSAHSALFCCCQCNLFVRCTPRFTRGSFHGWKPDAASKPWKTFHCSPPHYLVTGKHAVVWAQYFSATAVIPHFKFSTHFLRLQNRMLINLLCDKAISRGLWLSQVKDQPWAHIRLNFFAHWQENCSGRAAASLICCSRFVCKFLFNGSGMAVLRTSMAAA